MKRLLHVLPTVSSSYGGPVRVAEAMARHLPARGFEVTLFPTEDRPAGPAFWPGARAVKRLHSLVAAADLVHVHGLWTFPTSLAARFARSLRKPYVITPHGMLDRWSRRRSKWKKRVWAAAFENENLRSAAALHFFNREEREEAQDVVDGLPSFVLPNGVSLSEFASLPGRASLSKWLVPTQGERVLLFLGRLHPKKGFDVLLPALATVSRRCAFQLLVAGPDEGGYRAEVARLAADAGVTERVHFLGEVLGEDKRRLLGGADLFVLPSHQEGDSIAIKEALASGLPLLVSDKCHCPEVATSGAGLVVADSVRPMAEALEALCTEAEPSLSARRERARILAQRYDWGELISRLADEYRRLV